MTGEARKIRLVMELRQAGVTETRVLAAMERVPRELFVPEPFRDQAYANIALPIGAGQTLSQPAIVARMTQALALGERMKVLEVGTGSGYQTAVLSKLCRRVYTMEQHRHLLQAAEKRFRQLGLHNVTSRTGDGHTGWPEQAPFDRIIVTAAAEEIPAGLADQLAVGGLMIVPVGPRHGEQHLTRVVRTEEGLDVHSIGTVRFVALARGRSS
ncbi:MAG: protein-L-isoaspartate(D-aspartate) O-methyltransferase [Alphaproteobacteria bacterium]